MGNVRFVKKMTAEEFKAWLEGFSANIDGAPSKEQWEVVLKKAGEIQTSLAPVRDYNPVPPAWPKRWVDIGTVYTNTDPREKYTLECVDRWSAGQ